MSTAVPPSGTRTAFPGLVTREAVANALQRALDAERRRIGKGHPASRARVLAVAAEPRWEGPDTFTVPLEFPDPSGDTAPTVWVVGARSILEIVHALSRFDRDESLRYLVVLTPLDPAEFGESLLGRFLGEEIVRLDTWELLRTELKVTGIDPRLHAGRWTWLADTLRGVRGTRPLRLGTGVLKLEQALSIAVSVRFGRDPGEQVDSAALLEWTRDPKAVSAFTRLREDERDELRTALETALGSVPRVLFKLMDRDHGNALDAIPVGLALSELFDAVKHGAAGDEEQTLAARHALIRAQERYFGANRPKDADLVDFGNACTAALLRLLDGADQSHADETIRRAEELLSQLDAAHVAQASRLLDAGLHTRLAELGRQIGIALGPDDVSTAGEISLPLPQDLQEVEAALVRLREHRRHNQDRHRHAKAAAHAVRLLRRLALGGVDRPLGKVRQPTTAHEWIQAHVEDTGWVDRAASAIWHHRSDVPAFDQSLGDLYRRVRMWRARIDAEFAAVVNRWNSGHSATDPQLRSENLLDKVANPLGRDQAPLVIVLDGMSVEVAVQLAEDINAAGRFVEIGRPPARDRPAGRVGALATVPSTTNCSRASLLTGSLTTGKQDKERSGFSALWATVPFGHRKAVLYHQRDLEVGAGAHLPPEVQENIDDVQTVVGVVLNTIDDALARGREGDVSTWEVAQVGKLGSLLDAAARAGRPVLLTSDHGHVWDRADAVKTRPGEAARYRTGEPGDGEVLATGDRVLVGDGTLVVPYREDIRYTDRKEGYHGGFSAAEMVIPVLAFVPAFDRPRPDGTRRRSLSQDQVPTGWERLVPSQLEPVWWAQRLESTPAPAAKTPYDPWGDGTPAVRAESGPAAKADAPGRTGTAGGGRARRKDTAEQPPSLFDEADLAPRGLGAKVTETAVFEAGRGRVPKAPTAQEVAAVIDALVAVGGNQPRLPVGAAARAAGKPEAPHRAVRFLKMIGKVLNVEAYPVLTLTDGDRSVELNTTLLRQQFLNEGS